MGRSDVILDAVAYKLIFFGTLCALAWNGHALEAIFLWWLPRQIDLIYILFSSPGPRIIRQRKRAAAATPGHGAANWAMSDRWACSFT